MPKASSMSLLHIQHVIGAWIESLRRCVPRRIDQDAQAEQLKQVTELIQDFPHGLPVSWYAAPLVCHMCLEINLKYYLQQM